MLTGLVFLLVIAVGYLTLGLLLAAYYDRLDK